MNISVPEISEIISNTVQSDIKSDFKGKSLRFIDWVSEHRKEVSENKKLFQNKSEENDIKILKHFLPCLLAKNISGDQVDELNRVFSDKIISKKDLTNDNFQKILQESQYRWKSGEQVINDFVKWLNQNNWDWKKYFKDAETNKRNNFQEDKLLKIKNIKFKVRDLALSEFNENYIAFDLHVARVTTRMGLLNYGFDLFENEIEIGNNPSDGKQYLFLHKLLMKLVNMLDSKYSLSDLDRIFWHFGRTICQSKPKCNKCPIKNICLTGKNLNSYY